MNKTLILMIGVPASGKSTIAQRIFKEYFIPVVSSDSVREQLYGDENIQGSPNAVFAEVYRQANAFLETAGVCIIDATNVNRQNRLQAIVQTLPSEVVYIVADTDIEFAMQRNHLRERKVPPFVIERMDRQLRKDPPNLDNVKGLKVFRYDSDELEDFLEERFYDAH